jgi:hypothetical protein
VIPPSHPLPVVAFVSHCVPVFHAAFLVSTSCAVEERVHVFVNLKLGEE